MTHAHMLAEVQAWPSKCTGVQHDSDKELSKKLRCSIRHEMCRTVSRGCHRHHTTSCQTRHHSLSADLGVAAICKLSRGAAGVEAAWTCVPAPAQARLVLVLDTFLDCHTDAIVDTLAVRRP